VTPWFPGRIKLSIAGAQALGEGALRGIGYEYSGLAKILNVDQLAHDALVRLRGRNA